MVLRTEDLSSGLLWSLISGGVDCPVVGKMAAEPQALRVGDTTEDSVSSGLPSLNPFLGHIPRLLMPVLGSVRLSPRTFSWGISLTSIIVFQNKLL